MIALLVTGVSGGRWLHRFATLFRSIAWNALNQLTAVTNSVAQATFGYDPAGRRVERTANDGTTRWTYDRLSMLRGTTASMSSLFVPSRSIDHPLAQESGASPTTYLHADEIGNVIAASGPAAGRIIFVDDADGRPRESHEYDTLGRATTSEIGDGRDKLTFTYNTADKTSITDALGRQTVYEFVTANLHLPPGEQRTCPWEQGDLRVLPGALSRW